MSEQRIHGDREHFVPNNAARTTSLSADVSGEADHDDGRPSGAPGSASHCLIVLDPDGRMRSMSAGARLLLGYADAEVGGIPAPDFFGNGHEAQNSLRRSLHHAAAHGWVELCGTRRRSDGSEFRVGVVLTTIRGGNGSLVGFLMMLTDCSAERHRRDVEARAAHAVVEAMEIKSNFLANVSHELRTPLNALIGYADLVLETELNDEQREAVGRMRIAAESMHALTVNLLDHAKVERRSLEIERTPFKLRTMLQDALTAVALRAHSKGLELCCDVRPDVPDDVQGSATRLGQTLEQILDNAVKFTVAGEIVVRVALDAAAHSLVHFSITDTGIGIPSDKLGMVFEPFVQVDGSMRRTYGGVGLGLTIARQLVEHMGGEIWIESGSGIRGTAVHFTMRFGEARAVTRPAPKVPGLCILVADDNATARGILVETVQRLGMSTHEVDNANDAVSALRKGTADGRKLDLAIIDAELPYGSAATITTWVDRHSSHVPILLMTSPRHPADVLQYRHVSVAGYVAKPLSESHLTTVLLEAGRARRTRRARNGRERGRMRQGAVAL